MMKEPGRVRITGFADFVDFDTSEEDRIKIKTTLINQTKYLFPSLNWTSESKLWIGYR